MLFLLSEGDYFDEAKKKHHNVSMSKIMLVIDNEAERDFLDKILTRLSFTVIALKKGSVLSEQLLDHFPDVVFASTLGKNQKILTALAKIKEARGKPKVVFVRQERESSPLNTDQKKVIDGVVYSPIDPFKLIDVLASVTSKDLQELRTLYNEMLSKEKTPTQGEASSGQVFGIGGVSINTNTDGSKIITTGGNGKSKVEDSILIIDYKRKQKYQEICDKLKSERSEPPPEFNAKRLRDLQKQQSENISEDVEVKENRKHFLKTLFTMDPKKKA